VAVYTSFPTWDVPYFAIATPPRGASVTGDIWLFAGWKLYHSVNAGVNFASVWSFYHPDTIITVGALPSVVSAATGRDERALAARCVARRRHDEATASGAGGAVERQSLPVPAVSADGRASAYAVYVVGARAYHEASALWMSVDMGHSWIRLSGGNATSDQALGDSPTVLEASAQHPGTIMVGTGGRGIFERNVTAQIAAALLECE
jgi:hypothetical protein